MHRILGSTVLVLTAALSGCITHQSQYYVGSDDYVLATRDTGNGAKESYQLVVGSARGDASLRVRTEYDRERPFLGFKVVELDKPRAEKRGVKPYSGLLVQGTYPKSSAEVGGVLPGDVLLGLDGKETVYVAQLAAIEAPLSADHTVTAKVLRGQSEVELPLTVHLLKERVSDNQDVELEAGETHKPYAGVTLRGIPAVWAEKIWGQPRQAVVVANVEVGSPAWVAGIRGGDVIESVDGAPVPPVQELSRRIAQGGEHGQSMRWRVCRGKDDAYEAEIKLADYSGETKFWFPLVCYVEDGAYEDEWTVGPFGLLLSNRSHYVADSRTRVAKTRNVFNAILGLIHVETGPDETEVRLLWFISFDT